MKIDKRYIRNPYLKLYLPLYDLEGSTFQSKDSYGLTCTVTGTVKSPQGRYFDGSDDLITITQHPVLNLVDELSVLCWVKPTFGVQYGTLFRKNTNYLMKFQDNGYAWFDYNNGGWQTFGTPVGSMIANKFQLVSVIMKNVDGSYERKIYMNLKVVASDTSSVAMPADTSDAYIGGFPSDEFLQGTIGEFLIFSRALGPLEIKDFYTRTYKRYK